MSMAGNEVTLIGRAELDSIYQSLKKMNEEATKGMKGIEQAGKKTNDALDSAAKKTDSNLKRIGAGLRRMANQLYGDFKALGALESLQAGLKISSQFKGAVSESIKLSDTVRRLGGSFGIAKADFGKFHGALSKGLGDIGASSEAAANALQGLSGLGVKGGASAINLSKGAVELAGMSGEKGNEQSIAHLLGSSIQAQGKNVNDTGAQNAMIAAVTQAVNATGQKSSDILGNIEQIFSKMPDDLRKIINPKSMAQMAVMASTIGPGATSALQKYMGMTKQDRMGLSAQGFNPIGKNGEIDLKSLQAFIKDTKNRGLDSRSSLKTAGFSDEEAESLVRMGERANDLSEVFKKLESSSSDAEQSFKDSRGMVDNFKASINKLKGEAEGFFAPIEQGITNFLGKQSESTKGAATVVGGGALAAAVLAGGGLRGIFKAGLGEAKDKATEAITGEHVQKVHVTNFEDMALAGAAAGGGGGGGMGVMGKIGAVGGAAMLGYEIGDKIINPALSKYTQGTTSEGFQGDAAEQFFFKLNKMFGGDASKNIVKAQNDINVNIYHQAPNLPIKTAVSRGAKYR